MSERAWRVLELLAAVGAFGGLYAALRWLVVRLVRAVRVTAAALDAVVVLLDAKHDEHHYLDAATDADEITRRRHEQRRRIAEARARLWDARGVRP
jgi:hypothetical protein